jgi:hypothetical protein
VNEVIERAHHFFDWCDSVPDVDPVKIDVARLQAPEAGFDGLDHAFAVVARGVGVFAGDRVGVFRGQNDTFAMAYHEFAKKRFAGAIGVEICSVDEVAARFAESIVNFVGFVFGGAPAPFFPESHGTESCFRNSKTAVAQESISHEKILFVFLGWIRQMFGPEDYGLESGELQLKPGAQNT